MIMAKFHKTKYGTYVFHCAGKLYFITYER